MAQQITGTAGNDTLEGTDGDDILNGGAGHDEIWGYSGNDLLYGDAGNDTLDGGDGNDTYIFGRGDGKDIIQSDWDTRTDRLETLQFKAGITPDQVTVRATNNGLNLSINGTNDAISITDFYNNGSNPVQQVKFTDSSTVWDVAELRRRAMTGTTGNDYLHGTTGSDTLDGGAGNDTLQGNDGNDTYLFGRGDGQDTIESDWDNWNDDRLETLQFKTGITPDQVTVRADYYGLILSINGTNDVIRIRSFDNSEVNPVHQVKFTDSSTVWDVAELQRRAMIGTVGSDYLYGTTGDDTLDGGAGNDTLRGNDGNDTYLFGRGDGKDTIEADSDNRTDRLETLQFKAGITPDQVTVRANDAYYNTDLFLSINGTNDVIRIQSFYSSEANPDYQVKFTDSSTVWDFAELQRRAMIGTTGNDYLHGTTGNDTLDGGAGNDTLRGNGGDDTYLFGRGDGKDIIEYDWNTQTDRLETLQFKAGITPDQVTVRATDNGLILGINGTKDAISIPQFYYEGGHNPVQQVKFTDSSTVWDVAELQRRAMIGTVGNDYLYGTTGNDTLDGGAGNDTLHGSGGSDTLDGAAGDDYLYGSTGDDVLRGGEGNDYLYSDSGYSDSGSNTLEGGGGNDTIHIYSKTDTILFGHGDGNDNVRGGSIFKLKFKDGVAPDEVKGKLLNSSTIQLVLTSSNDRITLNDLTPSSNVRAEFSNGTIWTYADLKSLGQAGIPGSQNVNGTAGSDILIGGSGDDTLNGLGGSDSLSGGDGNDSLSGGWVSSSDSDTLVGGNGHDTLYGGYGNDLLQGNTGDDTVWGSSGNDTLDGGAGNDTLDGSSGNDTYLFGRGDGQDTVYNWSYGGSDTLQFKTGIRPEDVQVAPHVNGSSSLILSITGTDDRVEIDNFFSGDSESLKVTFAGSTTVWDQTALWKLAAQNFLTGGSGNETLAGTGQRDYIDGLAGNDLLSAVGASDTLVGGSGNDTLDASDDTYTGGAVLAGGIGDDVYVVSTVDGNLPTIVEYAEGGIDTLRSTGTYLFLPNNVENGILTAEGGYGSLYGNALANTLAGNSGSNWFDGGAGNDTLVGGGGSDNYLFSRGGGQDTIRALSTPGEAGQITVSNYQSGAPITPESVMVRQIGTSLRVSLNGTTDAMIVEGFFTDDDIDNPTNPIQGIEFQATQDFVVRTTLADMAQANLATTAVGSDSSDTLSGSAQADYMAGLGGNDSLSGGASQDTIEGGSGNDTLDGGTGSDILIGGAGDDVYVVDQGEVRSGTGIITNPGDQIMESPGGGIDEVKLYGTGYTLADQVENLVILGTYSSYAYGNALSNRMTGNAGGNWLRANAGNDTLSGGAGNDTYSFGFGDGQDLIVDERGSGDTTTRTDTLSFDSSVTPADVKLTWSGNTLVVAIGTGGDKVTVEGFKISNGVADPLNPIQQIQFYDETLWNSAKLVQMLASAAISGTEQADNLKGGDSDDLINGLAGNDTLTGFAGNDTLDGGTGTDKLIGGAGNDLYVVDNTADVVTELASEGTDIIHSSVTYTTSTNVEKLTLTGSAALNATGNALDNILTGNTGDNVLDALAHPITHKSPSPWRSARLARRC